DVDVIFVKPFLPAMAPIEEDSIAGRETATMLLVEQSRILAHIRQEHMHVLLSANGVPQTDGQAGLLGVRAVANQVDAHRAVGDWRRALPPGFQLVQHSPWELPVPNGREESIADPGSGESRMGIEERALPLVERLIVRYPDDGGLREFSREVGLANREFVILAAEQVDREDRGPEFGFEGFLREERVEPDLRKHPIPVGGELLAHGFPRALEFRRRFGNIDGLSLVAHLAKKIAEASSEAVDVVVELSLAGVQLLEVALS